MNVETLKMALRMYPPGRRVRFRDTPRVRTAFGDGGASAIGGSAPAEGTILQVLPDMSHDAIGDLVPPKFVVLVEFARGDAWDSVGFEPTDLEVTPGDVDALDLDLVGRTVHFARSSGIGIAFKPGSSDHGTIAAVRLERGWVHLRVAVNVEGREAPDVVDADFTQCQLLPRAARVR